MLPAVVYCALIATAIIGWRLLKFARSLDQQLQSSSPVVLHDPSCTVPAQLPSLLSPAAKSVSVIVPAYNEQDRLSATLDEAIGYLQSRRNRQGPHFTWEVIIVDDGSKDSTVRVAMKYVTRHGFDTVRVLQVPVNKGKGHAVRRGMLIARGEYCLFIDADGATRFADLEMLEASLAKVLQPSYSATGTDTAVGAAFGSRAHMQKAAAAKRSAVRNLLTQGFHFLVTFVAGSRIRDTQCGFKLFTRQAAVLLYHNQRLQRWCFDVELLYLADVLGIPVTEVFVQWTEMPGSKIRPTSILSMAWELLTVKVAYQVLGLWRVRVGPELGAGL